MTDPQVRQLAEQWLDENYAGVLESFAALGIAKFEIAKILVDFASHTRREALREAANLVEHPEKIRTNGQVGRLEIVAAIRP